MWVFLNDRFVRKEEALVSVFDHGFLYGDGVYETPSLLWNPHLHARPTPGPAPALRRSHRPDIPIPESHWPELLHEAMRRNGVGNEQTDAYLRITVSRGAGEIGLIPVCARGPRWSSWQSRSTPLLPYSHAMVCR